MVVHGNFEGQWVYEFDPTGQYLLQRGMVFFYPNPLARGGELKKGERPPGTRLPLNKGGRSEANDLPAPTHKFFTASGGGYGRGTSG
jgi:hypothetical protein